MKKLLLYILFSVLSCSACATNEFEKNYHALSTSSFKSKSCTSPQIQILNDNDKTQEIIENLVNYALIGQSEWLSKKQENSTSAMAYAQKVGACLVLWRSKYVGSVNSTKKEFFLPTATTSYFDVKTVQDGPFYKNPSDFNYYDVPVTYKYYRNTALFFVKK